MQELPEEWHAYSGRFLMGHPRRQKRRRTGVHHQDFHGGLHLAYWKLAQASGNDELLDRLDLVVEGIGGEHASNPSGILDHHVFPITYSAMGLTAQQAVNLYNANKRVDPLWRETRSTKLHVLYPLDPESFFVQVATEDAVPRRTIINATRPITRALRDVAAYSHAQ